MQLAAIVQTHGSADERFRTLSDSLFERAMKAQSPTNPDHTSLHETTLGKVGRLAITPQTSLTSLRPLRAPIPSLRKNHAHTRSIPSSPSGFALLQSPWAGFRTGMPGNHMQFA